MPKFMTTNDGLVIKVVQDTDGLRIECGDYCIALFANADGKLHLFSDVAVPGIAVDKRGFIEVVRDL